MPESKEYEFDLPFQRRLIAALWVGEGKKYQRLVKPDYFTDEVLQGAYRALLEVQKESKGVPDLPAVLEAVKGHVASGRKWGEYEVEIRRIWKRRASTSHAYYQGRAADFARRQAVESALIEAQRHLETGELDAIQGEVAKALRVGGAALDDDGDYFERAGTRSEHYVDPSQNGGAKRVPTGIGPLDGEIHGGLGPGELGCLMALPKHGKSSMLVSLGVQALLRGFSVLHVSLENSKSLTELKYDTCLTGLSHSQLAKKPNTFKRMMKEFGEKLSRKLCVSYFPTKSLTPSGLRGILDEKKPSLCLVDYAALMRGEAKRDDRRHEIADIFDSLRRVGGETGVPIWTAHQANRPGMGARILDMGHAAECFEVPAIADVMVSLNYDEEREGEITLYVMASRLGRMGFEIQCSVDFSISTIKPLLEES